jgi:hypothetical protein
MAANQIDNQSKPALSLDWWAVIVSLCAALLIRTGILPRIPW